MGCNMGVYLGQSIYNESQVTPEWVDDEIAKNGKGVFFTVIGTTTYNDTLDAYNDGKVVIAVKYDDVETEHATFYPLTTFDPDPDEGDEFTFSRDIDNIFEYYNLHIWGGWSSRYYKNIITVDQQLDSNSHNPVENMAIAAELTAINNKITGDLNDIFLALASKGVTVPAGAGLDDVAGLIDTVPTGAPEPIINPNIKPCLWVKKNNSSSLSMTIFFNISINDTIEFTFSPDTDILAADYTGLYGAISGLILLSNDVIIGYNYGNIVLSTNFSAYNNNVVVGDLIHDVLYNVKFKNGKLFFNSVENNSNAFNSSLSSIQYPNQNYNQPSIKFYEIKILDSAGVPYKRFVPAKNPNNDACLYECYSGDYYTLPNGGILGPEMPL